MSLTNECRFVGNLGRDPELGFTQRGAAMTKVSLAANMRVKRGDEWVNEPTWIPLVMFGPRAEHLAKWAKKGTLLNVVAEYETRSWEGDDGNTRYSHNFVIRDFDILSGSRTRDEVTEDVEESDFPF